MSKGVGIICYHLAYCDLASEIDLFYAQYPVRNIYMNKLCDYTNTCIY